MSIGIHWFRRDLRLTDNTALNAAAAAHDQVVPLFVLSNWRGERAWCGAARQEFLCGSLASLARDLEGKGGRLILRDGEADEALETLIRETGASAIYFASDPDPHGRAIEKCVASMAKRLGVTQHPHKDHALHERDEVLTGSGTPFRVFTPYARAWLRLDKDPPGRTIARLSTPPGIPSIDLPTLARWGITSNAQIVAPGEAAARKRLGRFLDRRLPDYGGLRDVPSLEITSRLSQDLRWGLLSVREIHAHCAELAASGGAALRKSIGVWMNELIWREFYLHVLWHTPSILDHEFQPECRTLKWRDRWRPEEGAGGEDFQRWCAGQTGFPIVDAGMRELAATGFMHNRVRMITAMFLTKDLHVWWMHGESWFMRRLVDGEIASNNGGWQWSASTGADAAPYFRIHNPWSQTRRFDPDGDYIRRWAPELRDVSRANLCAPPAGMPIAKGYPLPMVDHAVERRVALEMFRREK